MPVPSLIIFCAAGSCPDVALGGHPSAPL